MKWLVILPILMALMIAPAFAQPIPLSNANCTDPTISMGQSCGNGFPYGTATCIKFGNGNNLEYILTEDIYCPITSDFRGTTYYVTIDMNGHTINLTNYSYVKPAYAIQDVFYINIKNGHIIADWAMYGSSGGQESWAGIFFKNVTADIQQDFISAQRSLNVIGIDDIYLDGVTVNLHGNPSVFYETGLNNQATETFKNVNVNCDNTCSMTNGVQFFGDVNIENFQVNASTFWTSSGTSVFDDTQNWGAYTIHLFFKNSTKLDLDRSGGVIDTFEVADITAKDQNNNLIDANAEIMTDQGTDDVFSHNYNPNKDTLIGVKGGRASQYVLKDRTVEGTYTMNMSSYNITVRARNQAQTKTVSFHSPAKAEFIFSDEEPKFDFLRWLADALFGKAAHAQAQENFTLNFPSGGTIDNRTQSEVMTNNVTGFTIIMVAVGMVVLVTKAVF